SVRVSRLFVPLRGFFWAGPWGWFFSPLPSRGFTAPPQFNGALHLAVILGVGLQLLTVMIPGLRTLLGLEPLTPELLALVSTAVLLTWGAAEAYSRIAQAAHQARPQAREDAT